ncbi:MAG TPA: hypothetical protein VFU31_24595 [Candidatus Binatia bacterium]|nr:hypothetical protein [Candidatus Binatia bacterium]
MTSHYLQLSPEEQQQAWKLGLLGAGLGILAGNRGHGGALGPALGQGGLLGLQTYQGALQQGRQGKLQNLQYQQAQGALSMQQLQEQELKRQIAQREQYQKLLTEGGMGPGGKPFTPPQPAPVQQPAMYQDGKFVSQPDQQKVTDNMRATFAQSLLTRGQGLVQSGMQAGNVQAYEMGLKLMEQGTKFMPEVFKVEDAMQNGQPVQVMYFKDGTHAVVPGIKPKPNYNVINTGSQQIPVDLVTGQRSPAGAFRNELTPGDRAPQFQTFGDQAFITQRDPSAPGGMRITPAASGGEPIKQPPKPADIRKELHGTKEYQNWIVVRPVTEAARKAVKVDNAAADLDIIYAVAKQVDPDSVVREGETAMVVKTGSPAQQFMGTWNFVTGGGRLTGEQRNQLMRIIEDRGQAHYNNFLRVYEPYKVTIEKHKLDPKEIIDEKIFDFGKASTPAQGGDAPPTAPSGLIDRNKLVKGQSYTISGKKYKWNGMEFVSE